MSSGYDARGRRVAITKIQVNSNFVTQIKNVEKDGYEAVQIATGSKKSVRKPQTGHFKKIGVSESLRYVREVRTESVKGMEVGQELNISQIFRKGDAVSVTGTSKGKGFQGGVRRHGFHGGPKTHGQSDRHRAPGSIGSGTTPGRVYRGKRMAGHMGVDTVSVKNLEVIGLDKINNLIMIKGAVPGATGGLIRITKTGVIKGYTPPPEEKEEEEVASDVEQVRMSDVGDQKSEEAAMSVIPSDSEESVNDKERKGEGETK